MSRVEIKKSKQTFHLHICLYDAIDQKEEEEEVAFFPFVHSSEKKRSFFLSFRKIEH
jgi:hypothetical protein